MTNKFTVFIGGTGSGNNYSRGTGTTGKLSEIKVTRQKINSPEKIDLTIAGVDETDSNLVVESGGVRTSIYLYAGTNGSTGDTLVNRYRVDDVDFSSDGYCNIKGTIWMSGSGGQQLDESSVQESYTGTLKEILADLLPTSEGASDIADSLDVSGVTNNPSGLTFKTDKNWTRMDALNQLSKRYGLEWDYSE